MGIKPRSVALKVDDFLPGPRGGVLAGEERQRRDHRLRQLLTMISGLPHSTISSSMISVSDIDDLRALRHVSLHDWVFARSQHGKSETVHSLLQYTLQGDIAYLNHSGDDHTDDDDIVMMRRRRSMMMMVMMMAVMAMMI